MAEPDNLVLELLREMRADFRVLDEKLSTKTETKLDGLTHPVIAGFGALVHRLDGHETRLSCVERDRA